MATANLFEGCTVICYDITVSGLNLLGCSEEAVRRQIERIIENHGLAEQPVSIHFKPGTPAPSRGAAILVEAETMFVEQSNNERLNFMGVVLARQLMAYFSPLKFFFEGSSQRQASMASSS